MIKRFVLTAAVAMLSSAALAQVSTTVKEGAKATAETTKEAADNVKGSLSSQPDRAIDKTKAKMHKARAHAHARAAKEAARDIGR